MGLHTTRSTTDTCCLRQPLAITACLALLLATLAIPALAAPQPPGATPAWQHSSQRWPPNHYSDGWEHFEPEVRQLEDGGRFHWLAATFEVRRVRGGFELWRDLAGSTVLTLAASTRDGQLPLLMLHPWRGPHLAYFDHENTLQAVYPTGYYVLAAAPLAKRLAVDTRLDAVVARSGPVLSWLENGTRYTAVYYGKGYLPNAVQAVAGREEGYRLYVDGEGDAVLLVTNDTSTAALQYREGRGWTTERIGKAGMDCTASQNGETREITVHCQSRLSEVSWSSHSRRVLGLWWE